MKRIYKHGKIEIWQVVETYGNDFYVYSDETLVRVCPSIGMAHEIAGGIE